MGETRPLYEIGITWDIRPCVVCGEVHVRRELDGGAVTWKAEDGHPYRAKSWRQMAIEAWRATDA
jgi:hypothetical protein